MKKIIAVIIVSLLSVNGYSDQIQIAADSNNMAVSCQSTQQYYIIQYSTNLTGNWEYFGNQVITGDSLNNITDKYDQCFFKIKPVKELIFSNDTFRSAVMSSVVHKFYPTNQIFDIDAESVYHLDVSNISDYSGTRQPFYNIKELKNLYSLNIGSSQIRNLDVSGMTNLITLDCSSNDIWKINISNCTELQGLVCTKNQITDIVINNNPQLNYFICSQNYINDLNFSACTNLAYLDCSKNHLTNLNVNGCAKLETVDCSGNDSISYLDFSSCPILSSLDCRQYNLNQSLRLLKQIILYKTPEESFLYDGGLYPFTATIIILN